MLADSVDELCNLSPVAEYVDTTRMSCASGQYTVTDNKFLNERGESYTLSARKSMMREAISNVFLIGIYKVVLLDAPERVQLYS